MRKFRLPLLAVSLLLALTMLVAIPVRASDVFTFVPLPPISNRDFFYGGSTMPIKFQLFDSDGNIISTATAIIIVNGQPGTPGKSSTGNMFTFDPSSQQYMYHLNTKPLPVPGPNNITIVITSPISFTWTKIITLH